MRRLLILLFVLNIYCYPDSSSYQSAEEHLNEDPSSIEISGYEYIRKQQGNANNNESSERDPNNKIFEDWLYDYRVSKELKDADVGDLFGSNLHINYPSQYAYSDLGRRFVPVYPYSENRNHQNEYRQQRHENHLIPKRASPEMVMAVAKQSALLENARPINPSDELINKNVLRTGEYWNSVWKEDANPDPVPVLRTNALKKSGSKARQGKKLESVKANIYAGSRLYSAISKLKQDTPQLLYVINVHDDKK